VCIARAVATRPDLLVCDEITSALDVSVQAEIVALLRGLQDAGMALLFVTHNIALVSNIAERVAVLNQGRIVEYGPVGRVMSAPEHEYARADRRHPGLRAGARGRLTPGPGPGRSAQGQNRTDMTSPTWRKPTLR
jgi:ABC-type glutathione transport system ATPase component